ncbi:rRNA biogenesis protein rrp36 [Actinomortierella wolfii]|nr:rRNA biogenesis protein rrp36 [Actinomortierella wolfii]
MAKIDERALRRMQAFDDNEEDSGSDQGPVEWESASEMESDVGEYSGSSNESEVSEEEEEEEESQDDDDDEEDEESEDDEDDSESEESEEDEDSDDSGSDSDSHERKLKELQHNLSQIPFDKLAEIQQKVGMKAFQKTMRGPSKSQGGTKASKSKRLPDSDDEDEDDSDGSEDDQPHTRSAGGKMDRLLAMGKEKREKKAVAKRENKNRPMEITSKKPVSRFRQVVEVPTVKRRDPRFDSLSGKLNVDLFERSYGFLKEYQQDEMRKLRELIKKEKNQELKEKMQRELSRMVDRQATEAAQKRQKEIKREHKRKEQELIAKGKKPFFLKRADQKKLALIEKFESLKDSPKALSKAMERRRKRNAAKEKVKVLGVKRRRVD